MTFPNLNRAALVIKPKKPFYDWLAYHDPEFMLEDMVGNDKVILIPDFEEVDDCHKWLKQNHDIVFIEFLSGWYMDESYWPADRSFKLFTEWFEYSFHIMVYDADESDLEWY